MIKNSWNIFVLVLGLFSFKSEPEAEVGQQGSLLGLLR